MTDLKKYGAWSLTKLQTANNCSLKFKWEYIDKLPKGSIVKSEGRVGAAVHKCLELLLNGEEINRAINVAAVDNKLSYNEIESLACFKENMLNFVDRMKKWKSTHPLEKECIELKFGIDANFRPVGFWDKSAVFRGAWDIGYKTQKKSLVILDHKSGNEKPVENYSDQLKSYAVSGLALYPDISEVDTRIHYIQTKNIINGPLVPANKIRDELFPWLWTFIEQSTILIDSEPAKPTKGWYCSYCPYKSICPAWHSNTETQEEAPVDLKPGDPNNI